MNKVDLHLHTNLSDGLISPEEVVIMAKQNGCQIISITDHELSNNYDYLSKKYNINIVSGVEFNTAVSNMHLLGFGITNFDEFNKIMIKLRKLNERICIEVIEKLKKDGFDISLEMLKEYLYKLNLDTQILDKRKLVKYLMYKEYSKSIVDTYNRLIGKGQKYYVPNIKFSPKEIIELIEACGGVTILAHPNTITNDRRELLKRIIELKDYGLFGIEVVNSKMKLTETEYYQSIANKYGLLETYGSDFHDPSIDYIGHEINSDKAERIYESLVLRKKI